MFAGPATLLFCGVVVIPLVYGFYLTFTSWDGISKSKPFVGITNYIAAFGDGAFWVAMGRTLIYSAIAVILVNVMAFLLAYMVTRGIKGQNFFRAGFFIPNLIGGIVLGYVWKFVFNSAFVAIGENLNIGFLKNSWLGTPSGAMACMIIVAVWQYAGYMMLIYVAGFMSVSKSLIEAAQIDGASEFTIFWKVMLPLAVPVIATISLFTGLCYWNDWTNGLYYVDNEKLYSIQQLLMKIMDNIQALRSNSNAALLGTGQVDLPGTSIRMAMAVIGILPILAIYPFIQKYLVKGVIVGAVKG